MRRLTFEAYSAAFGVAYLCLATNALLVVGSLPLVFLLVTTDPARSWPLIACAVPLAAPSVAGAFAVFRDHLAGGTAVVRTFLAGWRASARRASQVAGLASVTVVVVVVDIRYVAGGPAGVVFIPALVVVAVVVVASAPVTLVAVVEAPRASLTTLLRVSAYLTLKRCPAAVASVVVLVTQFVLFANLPAIALGITTAPTLYVVWANGRYILAPATTDARARSSKESH
jgi:uncharacterized membrane protein YesL